MTRLEKRREVMDAQAIHRALDRMAMEVVERGQGVEDLALVGIHTGGVPLAHRLQKRLAAHGDVLVGMIDITLYRDDVLMGLPQPIVGETELPFEVTGRRLLLVDDVLYTGRTVRAALDALIDFGRPRAIQLAVLVDRGHRELPIHADFVGRPVETTRFESVQVELQELGAPADCVVIQVAREGDAP